MCISGSIRLVDLCKRCPASQLCSCRTSLFFFLLFSAVDHKLHSPCSLCFSQVRKFVSKDSAGLRVRSHPSLQSDQIGIVHVNGTIIFIDEVTDCRPARIKPICLINIQAVRFDSIYFFESIMVRSFQIKYYNFFFASVKPSLMMFIFCIIIIPLNFIIFSNLIFLIASYSCKLARWEALIPASVIWR